MGSVSRPAVRDDATLGAPSVGTWRPSVGLGHPITPGLALGVLVRDGVPLTVFAPPAVGGVAVSVAEAGRWVAYGEVLVRTGEGGLAEEGEAVVPVSGGPEGAVAVRAETDGTVYLHPEPGTPAYAPEGQAVDANDTVALVEVMKTFTPVRAPVAGTVVRVDVLDAGSVAAGDAIVWVKP